MTKPRLCERCVAVIPANRFWCRRCYLLVAGELHCRGIALPANTPSEGRAAMLLLKHQQGRPAGALHRSTWKRAWFKPVRSPAADWENAVNNLEESGHA